MGRRSTRLRSAKAAGSQFVNVADRRDRRRHRRDVDRELVDVDARNHHDTINGYHNYDYSRGPVQHEFLLSIPLSN
jgi:hypothetical protein